MESIIFDYYGYNFSYTSKPYKYLGYIFTLISCEENETYIENMQQIVNKMAVLFNNDTVFIVKNKYNKYISTTIDNKNICLLTYKEDIKVSYDSLTYMHQSFLNQFNYYIDLQEIIILWDQRIEYIQNQCLINLNFENELHLKLYNYAIYAIGVAINSLQYLKDIKIDFNRKYNSSLNHRRINSFDTFELFNPFNFIIDHTSRDLAFCFANNFISLEKLIEITYMYNYQIDEYQLLLARLLFPNCIFDLLEDLKDDNVSLESVSCIKKTMNIFDNRIIKIKQLYIYLINNMNIRPIMWIEHL